MNGNKIESHEGVDNTMVPAQERGQSDSTDGEDEQHERSQQDEERPKRKWVILQAVLLIVALGLAGYNHYLLTHSGEKGPSENMVLESVEIVRGDECNEGGVKFQAGIDENGNLLLDDDEITTSTVLCNGNQGATGGSGIGGSDGISAIQPLVNTTQLPPGDTACPSGGSIVITGLDDDRSGALDEQEVMSRHTICNGINGTSGSDGTAGLNGLDGLNGTEGASALIERYDAPAYLCDHGFVLDFGIDNGQGLGTPFDGLLHDDEVKTSLKFCFVPMNSERITDIAEDSTDSFTATCEQGGFLSESHRLIFAATDGVNGCELYVSNGTADSSRLLVNINPSGESKPGKEIGFTVLENSDEEVLIFDADDGTNGRQIWVTNGTEAGTFLLGESLMDGPVPWMGGVVLRSVQQNLLWTNGTELIPLTHHPIWNSTTSTAITNSLSGLSSLGSGMLHAKDGTLWFNAEDSNTDDEAYSLNIQGVLTHWDLNPNSGTTFVDWVSSQNDLYVVANRGTVHQLARLGHNGSSQWLTNLAPVSGDTHMADVLGLHLVNTTLVYDARLSGSDSRLWATDISSSATVQLSNIIYAPGSSLGGVLSNHGLMFDCFIAAHGTELCMTDGSPNGTYLISDATPGVTSSNLVAAVGLGEYWLLLASGYDGVTSNGVSLWSSDGTELTLRYNPWQGASNSSQAGSYGGLLVTSTQVLFIAHDGATGHEWHRWSHGELSDDWIVFNGQ